MRAACSFKVQRFDAFLHILSLNAPPKKSVNNCSFIPRHTAAPAANMGAIVQQHA